MAADDAALEAAALVEAALVDAAVLDAAVLDAAAEEAAEDALPEALLAAEDDPDEQPTASTIANAHADATAANFAKRDDFIIEPLSQTICIMVTRTTQASCTGRQLALSGALRRHSAPPAAPTPRSPPHSKFESLSAIKARIRSKLTGR